MTKWVMLKFTAMNLKKLAGWKWKERFLCWIFRLFLSTCARNPAVARRTDGFFDRLKGGICRPYTFYTYAVAYPMLKNLRYFQYR